MKTFFRLESVMGLILPLALLSHLNLAAPYVGQLQPGVGNELLPHRSYRSEFAMPMPVDKLWDLMRPGKKGGDGSLDSYPFLRSQDLVRGGGVRHYISKKSANGDKYEDLNRYLEYLNLLHPKL